MNICFMHASHHLKLMLKGRTLAPDLLRCHWVCEALIYYCLVTWPIRSVLYQCWLHHMWHIRWNCRLWLGLHSVKPLPRDLGYVRWNTPPILWFCCCAGMILFMCSANERWCNIVTSSPIGWAHTQNDPCCVWMSSPVLQTFILYVLVIEVHIMLIKGLFQLFVLNE